MSRIRHAIAALVVVAIAVGGLSALDARERASAADDEGTVRGIPVLLDSIRRPGSRIDDGFVVAAGSVLVGDVVPSEFSNQYAGYFTEDHGWSALLLVTGDPVQVIERYLVQAESVGIPKRVDAQDGCRGTTSNFLVCELSYWNGPTSFSRGIAMTLYRGESPATSTLLLKYTDTGPPPPNYPDDSLIDVYAPEGTVVPHVELPTNWKPLAQPGQRLSQRSPVRLEPGSELVAPVTFSKCTDGIMAVLRVTSDASEVIDAYAKQFGVNGNSVTRTKRRDDGATIIVVDAYGVSAEAVLRKNRPTYIEITECVG